MVEEKEKRLDDISDILVVDIPRDLKAPDVERTQERVTRNDLVDMIEPHIFLPKEEIRKFVDIIFYSILESVMGGKSVWLQGFGTFSMYEKGYTHGYNPYYQEFLTIPPRKYLRFRPARSVRRHLNKYTKEEGIYNKPEVQLKWERLKEAKDRLSEDPFGDAYEVA